MEKNLTIGKVNIDLTHYSGSDLYTEGEIEDNLLKVAEENDPASFRKVIEGKDEWAYLYHLSPVRENIVSWLPIKKDEKVLEVGSGMGAICGELCKLAGTVDTVDLSLKRSKVNANRNKDKDNLCIKVGNFTDIEPDLNNDYDWIMLIGVFEYAISYIHTDSPFEDFLKILKKHLKPNGRLVIAIENRIGLKYFAGCKEDHTNGFFDGIESYVNGGQVRTFSKTGLENILKSIGINEYYFYYPYPDYKLPNTIFSEKRLPKTGECKDNIRNFDQDRILLFDETNAFDGMIKEDLFPMFSNSFEVIIGPDVNVEYAKYSEERDDRFCTATIISSKEGLHNDEKLADSLHNAEECQIGLHKNDHDFLQKVITKRAIFDAGKAHIGNINKAYSELCKRYEGSDININKVLSFDDNKGEISFEYVSGDTLEDLLDELVEKNDKENFLKLFNRYKEVVSYNASYPVNDMDMIFSNIIVDGEAWTIIDYEWTFFEECNPKDVIARAVSNYLLGSKKREVIKSWIEEEYSFDENAFQAKILSENKAFSTIRHQIGHGIYNLDYILDRVAALNIRVQIYEDFGEGFKEENSYYLVDIKKQGPGMLLNIPLKSGLKNLRVDPGDKPVRFYVNHIYLNDEDVTEKMMGLLKNGCLDLRSSIQKNNTIIFRKDDPHVKFSLKGFNVSDSDVLKIDCRAEYIY